MRSVAHDPRRIFLSGPPGSGKSTIGPALAARLGCAFVDLDEVVAARARKSVRAIFEEEGEPAFRALEREEAMRLAVAPAPFVAALGGGTVLERETRFAMLEHGTLVGLDADPQVLAARAAAVASRPLLLGDVASRLSALLEARRGAYHERAGLVRTDHDDIERAVEEVIQIVERDPVVVPLGERTYAVDIGHGLRSTLFERLRSLRPSSVVVVTDEQVAGLVQPLVEALAATQLPTATVVLAPGEAHKTSASVQRIWDEVLATEPDRSTVVLAVGGGVVGDLAGFAAATLLRGIRFVQLPTTLLAMVDASVGGKTGFDHPRGKNLVGAFHQPSAVVVDMDMLATLPDRQLSNGLAEVAKMALLVGEDALAALERDADALLARDHLALERAVRMAVRAKAVVIARDERETRGLREMLNVGHTVGHALEAAAGFDDGLLHGEAVALGLVAELCAWPASEDGSELVRRVARLLDRLGLPTDVRGRLDERVVTFLASDKKREGRVLRIPRVRAAGDVVLERTSAAGMLERVFANLSVVPSLR